jgi:hypothetical protein
MTSNIVGIVAIVISVAALIVNARTYYILRRRK